MKFQFPRYKGFNADIFGQALSFINKKINYLFHVLEVTPKSRVKFVNRKLRIFLKPPVALGRGF